MPMPRSRLFVFLYASLLACACSTTPAPTVSDWRNPAYSSDSFKRIMVGSLSGDHSVRRNLEDEFVVQLRAVGVDALPSYRFTEGEKLDEALLKESAQKARSDGLLSVRLIKTEEKTQYGQTGFPYTTLGVFGDNAAVSWSGLGGATTVTRYNEYVSETTLQDLGKNEIVWTGTIRTTQPNNVQTGIRSYVDAVMKTLRERNLISKGGG
jgi:hypothetical protein